MADEKKSIFSQKALDRIASPEDLDQYLKVTKPSTWITLGAIVFLLLGFMAWGILGHLTTVAEVAVFSADNQALCLIPESVMVEISDDTTVTIADTAYPLVDSSIAPMIVDDSIDARLRMAGKLINGTIVYVMAVDAQLDDGVYIGQIEVESITPMSFILN